MKDAIRQPDLAADPVFPRLKAHIVSSTGLAYFATREADLLARLQRRFAATGAPDCGRYLALLLDPASSEQEALVRELTIGETHFFRFQEQFDALRERVVPELLRANADRRQLRIWSAGCATGPEPYSVALVLEREFRHLLGDWTVSLLGTDLNREFLRRAEAGIFPEWSLRGLPDAIRHECFGRAPGGWQIAARFRHQIRFQHHNLIEGAPPDPFGPANEFDLILCRNVLIYFDSETIRQVIASLRRRLVPGGWLLLGHAENSPELEVGFQAHSARGTVLYQKLAGPAWDTSPAPASVPSTAPLPPLSPPAASFGTAPLNKLAQWRPYPLEVPDTSVEPAPVASITPRPPAAAAMPPEEPVTEIQRLRFLANSGSWQEADACSAALLRQEPLNPLAHFYRGLVLGQTGRQAAAEEALRKALFLEPDLGLAYYQLGLLLSARGDRAGAARAFRNTLRAVEPLPGEAVLDGADLTAAQLREAASLHLREPGA